MRLDHLLSKERLARLVRPVGRGVGFRATAWTGVPGWLLVGGTSTSWLLVHRRVSTSVPCSGWRGTRGGGGWSGTLLGPEGTGVWSGLSRAASSVEPLGLGLLLLVALLLVVVAWGWVGAGCGVGSVRCLRTA